MRKSILFALASLAILPLACVKETAPEEQKPSDNPNIVVFTAPAPKTTIDANDKVVSWAAGDEVKFVWDGGSTTASASAAGAETTFTVEVDAGITELYAIYPASAGGAYADGKVNVTFPSSITDGSFAANDICVAKAAKDGSWDTTLAFKNVACIMKVGITDSAITKIQVMGGRTTDEAIAISGTLPVSMDESGNPFFGTATSTGKTVTLTISESGDYYIPILPNVVLSDGFRIGVFKGDDQLTPFFYNGSYTTAKGKILKFPAIDSHAGQYYVTKSGGTERQTGQSWTSAMGVDEFKAFVTDEDNHFLLKGATFHFSAEEFSFGDDYLVLNYPNHSNVAFTLEGTVTASDTTTFRGRTADATAGVLWPQANSYITVKNVKFTETNGASNASPIRVNNGAVELNLDHCYFRGNQTSGNGGGISVFNGATVNITDCSFSGATGMGGIIHVNNASAKVTITDTEAKGITKNAIYVQSVNEFNCTRVVFKGNKTGAAAYITGAGNISFDDCDFTNNQASEAPSILVTGAAEVEVKKGCTFTNNSGKGSAIKINNASAAVEIEDCEISGAETSAIWGVNANTVSCTRVNIHDNEADSNGGAGAYLEGAGTYSFTNCTFKKNSSPQHGGAVVIASGDVHATFTGGKFLENHADGTSEDSENNQYIGGSAIYAMGTNVAFDCTNVEFNGNYYDFGSSTIDKDDSPSTNHVGGIIQVRSDSGLARFNGCTFDGNYQKGSNSNLTGIAGAAILLIKDTTPTIYFNACEFKNNYSAKGHQAMVFGVTQAATIAMNNCSWHDNRSGRNSSGNASWIMVTNGSANILISNSSIIGDQQRSSGVGKEGVIKFEAGKVKLINNILCSNYSDGASIRCTSSLNLYSYYNKTSQGYDSNTVWNTDTGSGHDYTANTTYFSDWSTPYTWSGTMPAGTNNDQLATTAKVNTQIQNADADFYAWLNSIGALGKDINGNPRGTTSWPGCYQSN